jgi:hypothetical protein
MRKIYVPYVPRIPGKVGVYIDIDIHYAMFNKLRFFIMGVLIRAITQLARPMKVQVVYHVNGGNR